MLTQFATTRAGLILVNLNPAYRWTELEFALRKVGCRMLILAASFKNSDYLGIAGAILPASAFEESGRMRADRCPSLEWVVQLGPEAARANHRPATHNRPMKFRLFRRTQKSPKSDT